MEAVYSGAKGGLIAFTKTIARESARAGVTANSVCPGPTDTPFFEQPLMKTWNPGKLHRMKSRVVADLGMKGFRNRKSLVVTGTFNKMMIFGSRFAPRQMVVKAARKIIERKGIPT